jgi:hypothetical protein
MPELLLLSQEELNALGEELENDNIDQDRLAEVTKALEGYHFNEFQGIWECKPSTPTTKLFVYGIFLGQTMRHYHNMTNPVYATVADFTTVGGHIVQAKYDPHHHYALTGLLVDVPVDEWTKGLDTLEGGYERVRITTTNNEQAYMYAEPGTAEAIGSENYSTWVPYYKRQRSIKRERKEK